MVIQAWKIGKGRQSTIRPSPVTSEKQKKAFDLRVLEIEAEVKSGELSSANAATQLFELIHALKDVNIRNAVVQIFLTKYVELLRAQAEKNTKKKKKSMKGGRKK